MKGYLYVSGLCFGLGVAGTLYFGIAGDVNAVMAAFNERDAQVAELDIVERQERVQLAKLETTLKGLEVEVRRKEIELEIELVGVAAESERQAIRAQAANAVEWDWWMSALKIFWAVAIGAVIPTVFLSIVILRIALSVFAQ